MEEKKPATVRIPEDIVPVWWPTMEDLKPKVRGNTYGNTQGTAITLFMGLPVDLQKNLIRLFLDRPGGMTKEEVTAFAQSLLRAVIDAAQAPDGTQMLEPQVSAERP